MTIPFHFVKIEAIFRSRFARFFRDGWYRFVVFFRFLLAMISSSFLVDKLHLSVNLRRSLPNDLAKT